MKNYFKILKDTITYEKVNAVFENKQRYADLYETIKNEFYLDEGSKVCICATNMAVKNPPQHLDKQFKKENRYGIRYAKQNSKINKKWVNFCIEHKLTNLTMRDLRLNLDWFFAPSMLFYKMYDNYCIEADPKDQSECAFFDRQKDLEKISELVYAKIRAEFLQSEEDLKLKEKS